MLGQQILGTWMPELAFKCFNKQTHTHKISQLKDDFTGVFAETQYKLDSHGCLNAMAVFGKRVVYSIETNKL